MRFSHCVVVPTLTLLSMCGWAAEPAPKVPAVVAALPVFEAHLADGKDLLAHWEKTPWAKMWADPALKPLHQPVDEWQAQAAKDLGGTPTELIAAIANAILKITPLPASAAGAEKPQIPMAIYAGVDLGTFATSLFTMAKKAGGEHRTSTDATVAGADEAIAEEDHADRMLARFATSLALGIQTLPTRPVMRTTPMKDDLLITADVPGIFTMLLGAMSAGPQRDTVVRMQKQCAELKVTEGSYRLDIVPEGFLEVIDMGKASIIGYKPVDRAMLARLPANTLMAVAIGYDGITLWKQQRVNLLPDWAPMVGTKAEDIDATEKALNEMIVSVGFDISLEEIFTSLTGTSLFSISPAMPFPGVSVSMPRSPALDKLIASGLKKLEMTPPAEGASTLIPIPNMPVALTLVCDRTSWLISTDPVLADQWLGGKANGWADSPAAKLALSKAPADAYLIGSSDTQGVLRMLAGYAGMGLSMATMITPEQRQAVLAGLNILATNASTGYMVSGTNAQGRVVTEMRSLTGALPGFGLIGGIGAATAMMRQQHVAHEMNKPEIVSDPNDPLVVLHELIFPAQEQFRAGGYRDQDGNGRGEFGLLSELAGRRAVGNEQRLGLIEGPLARGATAGGYAYTIYLPGEVTRVADDGKTETRPAVPGNAKLQEEKYVAYAWPSRAKDGKMYAMLADGAVYQADYRGVPPAWNAVFGGAGFEAQPTWKETAAGGEGESEEDTESATPPTTVTPMAPEPTPIP